MASVQEKVGAIGLFLAGTIFKIALYVCVGVLIFWLGKSSYSFGYDILNEKAMSPGAGQEITVVIEEGSSVYEIGKLLKSKGLIKNSLVFYVQEKLSIYKGELRSGTYVLSTAYTPTRIMGILAGDEEQEGAS